MPSPDFANLVRARHTVRDFLPTEVQADLLSAILDDAAQVASWSNTRAYCMAIATGERLERLKSAYTDAFNASLGLQRREPTAVARAALATVTRNQKNAFPDGDFPAWKPYPAELLPRSRGVGKALLQHEGIVREDLSGREAHTRRNFALFGAPVGMWFFVHKKMLPMSAMDLGMVIDTIMLSATSRGLGTCALGSLAIWRYPIEAEFEVPKDYQLITGLALGYASDAPVNDFRADHPPLSLVDPRY